MRFRHLVESSRDGLLVVGAGGQVLFDNPSARELLGWGKKPPEEHVWEHGESGELALSADDGQPRIVELVTGDTVWEGRRARLVSLRDATERRSAEARERSLEQQLHQAQKLEAIGRLAGGVAHDFNNLLGAILGYAQLARRKMDQPERLAHDLAGIEQVAQRGARLTRQLLAFSRRQTIEPRVLDLGRTLEEMQPLLQRLIGEDVEVRLSIGSAPGRVRADPSQIEQVILNLAINARDAMPRGGTLELALVNERVDQPQALLLGDELQPGRYMLLTVRDTGEGIPAAIVAQVFEPFFTTKEQGKGTGLGLATVCGIVAQHGGAIDVATAEGRGSTFKVYLPQVDEPLEQPAPPISGPVAGGSETILLVEDDEHLRPLSVRALADQGYTVLAAAGGAEALGLLERSGRVHLLLADVVMPEMSGVELLGRVRALHPGLPALFISGYPHEAIARHGMLDADLPLLVKPFTPDELAARVRQVLDAH